MSVAKPIHQNGQAKLPGFDPTLYLQLRAVKNGIIAGPIVGNIAISRKIAEAYLKKFEYDFRLHSKGKERRKPEPIEDVLRLYSQAKMVVEGKLAPFRVGNKDFTPAVAQEYIDGHRAEVGAHLRGIKRHNSGNGFSNGKHTLAESIMH